MSACAALTLNIFSLPYAAATNTITFTGSITDATCDVSLEYKGAEVGSNGTGTIPLDEVSKADLSAAGSYAGAMPFFIVAKNCKFSETDTRTKVAADFKSVDADNLGYLNNTAQTGAATNVQFELLDANGNMIKVNDLNQSATTAFTDIATDPAATKMPYYVRYYSAAGTATAGAVKGTVDYELMYQ